MVAPSLIDKMNIYRRNYGSKKESSANLWFLDTKSEVLTPKGARGRKVTKSQLMGSKVGYMKLFAEVLATVGTSNKE